MAYLDFSQCLAQNSVAATLPRKPGPAAARAGDHTAGASFTALEWKVIGLARHDGLDTLHPPRPRSWIGALIFGQRRDHALSSERLEALRRLAVEVWHRSHEVSLPSLAAFEAAGFSRAQFTLLLAAATDGGTPAPPDSENRSALLKTTTPRSFA